MNAAQDSLSYLVSVAARPSGRGQRGRQVRSRTGGAQGSAAEVVWLARSEQFLSPQLGRRSTEMRQGHLGSWAPTSGGLRGLSLHTGKAGRKEVWPSLKCSCSLQESLSDTSLCVKALPVSIESQTEQALESQSLNK